MIKTGFSPDARILLIMTGCIALAMIPFAIIRFVQGDYPVAILNTTANVLTTAAFLHVYLTHKTYFAKITMVFVATTVIVSTCLLKGWQQIIWVYPTLALFYAVLSPRHSAIFSFFIIAIIAMVIHSEVASIYLLGFIVSSGSTSIFAYAFTNKMHTQSSILRDLVITDPLTGIANRRALEEELAKIIKELIKDAAANCSLIMLDIDYFKKINDDHGHNMGDLILREFATAITTKIRKKDSLYRLGGEEFVLLLPDTNADEAYTMAENLRIEIENTEWSDPKMLITMSLGIAEYSVGQNATEWLDSADKAMYQAKNDGRNKTVRSDELKKAD